MSINHSSYPTFNTPPESGNILRILKKHEEQFLLCYKISMWTNQPDSF